jgi:alkaline phosphatase D
MAQFHCKAPLALIVALGLGIYGVSPVQTRAEETPLQASAQITHGVAVGDVGARHAVIWSRANRESTLHVLLTPKHDGLPLYQSVQVKAEDDFTGKVRFTRLKPDTAYDYAVWFGGSEKSGLPLHGVATGQFRTAPAALKAQFVRFAWGGDLAGQNVCRDVTEGFPIFNVINQTRWDFFIGLGDMIYADGLCEATGLYQNAQIKGDFVQAADLANYWSHWKYNRADPAYRTLLADTPYLAIWDDHEVVNDFGPLHDTRNKPPYTPGVHLLPLGLKAFLDYNPVKPDADTPKHLYRTIRWGKHLELFILDTRQYRDANFAEDSSTKPKTLLGCEQLTWLKEKLKVSNATWKVIVSSVPMAIPTGSPPENGRDGWGNYDQPTGFEWELLDILKLMKEQGIYNNVWITTDVHFAEVFRYRPFPDNPAFRVHEFITGLTIPSFL